MPIAFSHSFVRIGLLIVMIGGLIGGGVWLNNRTNPAPSIDSRLTIAATIFPIVDIARAVAGPQVQVLQIIPPGITEHSADLAPEQLQKVQNARLVFQIGHNLDTALTAKISRSFPAIPLVTVDRGITLREFAADDHDAEESNVDPHYWLTIPNAQKIAATIADQLATLDPTHRPDYQHNLLIYTQKLADLEQVLQQQAQQSSTKEFIAMHNAWSYFADQYGLRLVATYEPVEGRQPSIADLSHLKEIIDQHHLHVFFSEPQKQSTSATRFLHDEFGLEIRVLDPVGGTGANDSYLNLLRNNMKAIVD